MAKAGDKKLIVMLIILFVVALGVLIALCYYKWIDNKATEDKIAEVDVQIAKQEAIKATIPELRQQRIQRVEAINQLTKILPTETETSHQEFLRLLRGFAEKSGVSVKTLEPPTELNDVELRIKRYRYVILLEGSFPDFVQFLNQIETHTRFLKVDMFEVANRDIRVDYWPDEPEKTIRLQITTYTYNPVE